ncbi:hypothetical protein D1818_22510 [Aquimarina sp. BL5]|nr:hypothetical protein D1818_22510 [Aquimarina sp. BL5]RKN01600.1 hypothetical protein D7036_17470 [Aquimarina sp. BL5]
MRFISNNSSAKVQENCILRLQKSNQMKVRRYIFAIGVVISALYACNNDDDDDGFVSIPPRDFTEQQEDEEPIIQSYLKTHFFTLVDNSANPDYQIIQFDTIAGDNSSQTSIWDSGLLESKTVTLNDIDYTLYFLKRNNGATSERKPTFADSAFVTYRGEIFYDNVDQDGDGIPDNADVDADGDNEPDNISDSETKTDSDGDGIADDADVDNNPDEPDSDGDGIIDEKDQVDNNNPNRKVFDSAITPVWFDLNSVVPGFREGTIEVSGASGFMENPDNGTVDYNMDFGDFTVFMPSGLAYFNEIQTGIPQYSPLIFSIQLYGMNQTDHDSDGIPSYLEDLEADSDLNVDRDGDGDSTNDIGDRNLSNDDTDGSVVPNFFDIDDDGDGTLTMDEVTVDDANEDGFIDIDLGEIIFYDDDGDGIPNHLDPDDSDPKND